MVIYCSPGKRKSADPMAEGPEIQQALDHCARLQIPCPVYEWIKGHKDLEKWYKVEEGPLGKQVVAARYIPPQTTVMVGAAQNCFICASTIGCNFGMHLFSGYSCLAWP